VAKDASFQINREREEYIEKEVASRVERAKEKWLQEEKTKWLEQEKEKWVQRKVLDKYLENELAERLESEKQKWLENKVAIQFEIEEFKRKTINQNKNERRRIRRLQLKNEEKKKPQQKQWTAEQLKAWNVQCKRKHDQTILELDKTKKEEAVKKRKLEKQPLPTPQNEFEILERALMFREADDNFTDSPWLPTQSVNIPRQDLQEIVNNHAAIMEEAATIILPTPSEHGTEILADDDDNEYEIIELGSPDLYEREIFEDLEEPFDEEEQPSFAEMLNMCGMSDE
jgi:hypothetical protein